MSGSRSGFERSDGYLLDVFPELCEGAGTRRFGLSEEQKALFERDGFLGPIRVLDDEQVAELGRRVDDLMGRARELEPMLYEVELAWQERPDDVVFHCLGGWRIDEWMHDIIRHPAVTVPAADCLGVERLRFWHDQIFAKPAGHPGVVPWHQDYSYWQRTAPAAHITVHIALDRADLDNGCIQYIPGSQGWGLFDTVDFGGDMDAFAQLLPEERRAEFAPVPMRLEPGEAVLHHSHVVHGSYGNGSDRPRRALVLNYMADGVRSQSNEPLLRGTPPVPVGKAVGGDFFPLVLDRRALLEGPGLGD